MSLSVHDLNLLASPPPPTPSSTEGSTPESLSSHSSHQHQLLPTESSNQSQPQNGEEQETRIHISTMFYPGSPMLPESLSSPDIALVTSDSVFFYVHSSVLVRASSNGFGGHIPAELSPPNPNLHPNPGQNSNDLNVLNNDTRFVPIAESADIINILLHTVYNLDCSHYSPSFPALVSAITEVFGKYGFDNKSFLANKSAPLYNVVISHAPSRPLDVYAFAASMGLEELAVACSSHLLSLPLHSLTDKTCSDMGPVYLKRLFFLHLGRVDALKRLLLSPPHPHPPTASCDFTEQKKLTRAWALASSYLLCDARPDTSVGMLEGALLPLGDHLWCDQCREMLRERIHTLSVSWSVVKTTI